LTATRLLARLAFPADDPEAAGDPRVALADVTELLVRLRPLRIVATLQIAPELLMVELLADFAVGEEDKPVLLRSALIRAEGDAGYRSDFPERPADPAGWMLASPRLDRPALPGGEPFALALPLEPALGTLLRRLRLTGVACGYRLSAAGDGGAPGLARRLAPAIAACTVRRGAAQSLIAPLEATIATVAAPGWTVEEGVCLSLDAPDSAAELVEEQLCAAIRESYPFLPEEVIGIDWRALPAADAAGPAADDWQEAISARRAAAYLPTALATTLHAAWAQRPSGPPPSPPAFGGGHAPTGPASPSPPPPSGGPFAFLSYAHAERTHLDRLANALGRHGIPFWFDDQIDPGSAWDDHLEARIRECALLIACVSPAYEASRYCRRELKFADLLAKPILPVTAGDYVWGPGLALMFQELQILRLTGADWEARVAAHSQRLAPACTAMTKH
jgi:hypothetical protein